MSRPILTAAEMRSAEERAIAAGTPVETLMERAGLGVAEAAWRFAGPLPALVLCGPGNNGGDGYVAARYLRTRGMDVRVAALGEPKAGAAASAYAAWDGPIESLDEARSAPLLIDALFGTGLSRGLDEQVAARLNALANAARVSVAVDLPSGVDTDTGAVLGPVPGFDLTVTFATLKPAHLLQPAASLCGRAVIVDIGIAAEAGMSELARPVLPAPGPHDHKYSRGLVVVLAGEMYGATALAAEAAAHSGAGYVRLIANEPLPVSHAIVQTRDPELVCHDERIGCVVVGPGLGRGQDAHTRLGVARRSGRSLVIDGDGLFHLGEWPERLDGDILTPHEGEFDRLFPGIEQASKVERAREAARRSGAVVVYKGADTVIAAPDERVAIGGGASPWLSTAGTGDVLAGVIGAMRARGLAPFEAAKAGVWLHAQAAAKAGKAFIADDLVRHLPDGL